MGIRKGFGPLFSSRTSRKTCSLIGRWTLQATKAASSKTRPGACISKQTTHSTFRWLLAGVLHPHHAAVAVCWCLLLICVLIMLLLLLLLLLRWLLLLVPLSLLLFAQVAPAAGTAESAAAAVAVAALAAACSNGARQDPSAWGGRGPIMCTLPGAPAAIGCCQYGRAPVGDKCLFMHGA